MATFSINCQETPKKSLYADNVPIIVETRPVVKLFLAKSLGIVAKTGYDMLYRCL